MLLEKDRKIWNRFSNDWNCNNNNTKRERFLQKKFRNSI